MSSSDSEHTDKNNDDFEGRHLFDIEQIKPGSPSSGKQEVYSNDLAQTVLTLGEISGLGFKTLCELYDEKLLLNEKNHSVEYTLKKVASHLNNSEQKRKKEISRKIYNDFEKYIKKGRKRLETLYDQNITFISKNDDFYPEEFLKLDPPPRWLFVEGDISTLLSDSIISFVGTRDPSSYGKNLAYKCAEKLAKEDFIILSGLAKGIDSSAHEGAVDNFGQSIAILGHGINANISKSQQNIRSDILKYDGAVVSEYLPNDPPSRDSYLRRNELVAGLPNVIIPVECPSMQSGTGATIRRSLKLDTPIMGIVPKNCDVDSLQRTKKNLQEIDADVFTFKNGDLNDFWNYLIAKYPGHDWNKENRSREIRFFKEMEQMVMDATDKLDLDENSIDRLAKRLKKLISGKDGKEVEND